MLGDREKVDHRVRDQWANALAPVAGDIIKMKAMSLTFLFSKMGMMFFSDYFLQESNEFPLTREGGQVVIIF